MDLKAREAALVTELGEVIALKDRALRAADEATIRIARIEGQLSIVRELVSAHGQS